MGLRKISWLIISTVAIYAFRWGWLFRSSKPGPDAVGDVRVGHGLGEGLCRAPSGAAGMIASAPILARASTEGLMIGSNAGPLR